MTQSFSRGIDVARIGACFMVVVLHVAAVEFHSFDGRWWASNFYDSFTRSCVPVFLMITGVLLLDRQEGLPVFFRKRVVRIVPPLVFWSLFYLFWHALQGQGHDEAGNSLVSLFKGPVAYHLWYLYALVGIYLFVPFLRHIWQASTHVEKSLYLSIWVIASAWPLLQTALNSELDLLTTYELSSFFGLSGYLFLGAYSRKVFGRYLYRPAYWWCNLTGFVLFSGTTMLITWLYSYRLGQPDPLFYDYLSPLVIAASLAAFNLLYGTGVWLARKQCMSEPVWTWVRHLAACTLGIYCIHIFVLDLFRSHIVLLQGDWSGWWTIPVAATLIFVTAWALIGLARRAALLRMVA